MGIFLQLFYDIRYLTYQFWNLREMVIILKNDLRFETKFKDGDEL